jgi:hypothetical protein
MVHLLSTQLWIPIALAASIPCLARARSMGTSSVSEQSLYLEKLNKILGGSVRGNSRSVEIDGQFEGKPVKVQLRLTNEGYRISVQVPLISSLRLSVLPKSVAKPGGTIVFETKDAWLSASKSIWANDHEAARTILGNDKVLETLKSLCTRPSFGISARGKRLELRGEAPAASVSEDILLSYVTQLLLLARLITPALRAKESPDATTRGIWRPRWMLATVAASVLVVSAVTVAQHHERPVAANFAQFAADGYRPITPSDLNSTAVSWVRAHGQEVSGVLQVDLSKNDSVARVDILKKQVSGTETNYRLVVQVDGKIALDQNYQSFAMALRVPTNYFARLRWVGPKPGPEIGKEAILLVKQESDVSSGEVLTWDGSFIRVYRPQDFTRL